MLHKQEIPVPTAGVYTNGASAPAGKAVKTVTGEFIAKATVNYPPWRRALDAVRWLRGQIIIEPPTLKLAAKTFGVSVPSVIAARKRLEQRERGKKHANGGGSTGLSDDAVERIVTEVGVDRIWRAVDRLTQPQLPL
jgi:hypothetical protein